VAVGLTDPTDPTFWGPCDLADWPAHSLGPCDSHESVLLDAC